MAERLQGSDFQRFFLIRIRLLFHQEAQNVGAAQVLMDIRYLT